MSPAPAQNRLHTLWEARRFRTAAIAAVATFLGAAVIGLGLRQAAVPLAASIPVALLLAIGVWVFTTRPVHRRRRILRRPFPFEWERILRRYVVFYGALRPEEQVRFQQEVKVFLGEKRITGIGTEVDETTRVLVAASAIIPIFGFPQWEWDQIREVLIYPERFDHGFAQEGGSPGSVLGVVGTGFMNHLMILSKPDLIAGFKNPSDGHNVGIHEFAHLVDKTDGHIDGLPLVGLEGKAIGPWLELVRQEMAAVHRGESGIRPYGGTNEEEFFAVATELFFERPSALRRDHPELYRLLAEVFQQPLHERAGAMTKAARSGSKRLGRNSPCPCGSGKKFKRCCRRLA